ncbi:hypothetical protein N7493_010369 [Penicillium malachiteum]|uniref:BTB domain-containing protein n=1 Tax=Penicillium malachiteum TaxID=1324776 RepID=A0AAD6HCS5_9EURO|nr:hypothetical protein N7493_010369 [Penicillium malachiteum]
MTNHFHLGKKRYSLLGCFIRKYPQFDRQLLWHTSIDLSDVHKDVGYTIVHFLYSESYKTIDSPLDEGESKIAREYKKAVLAYRASRTYKLPALESLAKRYIKLFGEAMATSDILQITREVFPKFSKDETWLPNHIKPNLQQFSISGESDTDLDALNTIFEPFAAVQSRESHSDYLPKEAAAEVYPKEAAAAEAYPEEAANIHSAKEESLPSPKNHTSKLYLAKYLLENVHLWVQNSDGAGRRAVKRSLAVQSDGWKGGRFWRQRLSFSASFSQVLIF